jgi:hypothetical protein
MGRGEAWREGGASQCSAASAYLCALWQAVAISFGKLRRRHFSCPPSDRLPTCSTCERSRTSTRCLVRLLLAVVGHSTPRDGGDMKYQHQHVWTSRSGTTNATMRRVDICSAVCMQTTCAVALDGNNRWSRAGLGTWMVWRRPMVMSLDLLGECFLCCYCCC